MLEKTIPSYLYVEYNEDEACQAFVNAYNEQAQNYLDTVRNLNLPNYTQAPIEGDLLDWVAGGVYGFDRPTFPTINLATIGPLNTYPLNTLAYNEFLNQNPDFTFYTSDDAFRRVLTWHLYRADGVQFNIRWFKRRVARFLYGEDGIWKQNGLDCAADTSRISVTFGPPYTVNLRIVNNVRRITGGAIFARFVLGRKAFAQMDSENEVYDPIPTAYFLNGAINGGILEVPFQFDYIVTQGGIAQFGPYEL